MKIERTKNASRNMIFGFLLKLYQIILPFFMRTAMIYLMGVQYLGLNYEMCCFCNSFYSLT